MMPETDFSSQKKYFQEVHQKIPKCDKVIKNSFKRNHVKDLRINLLFYKDACFRLHCFPAVKKM